MRLEFKLLILFIAVFLVSTLLFFAYSVPLMQGQISKMENPALELALEETITLLAQREIEAVDKIKKLGSSILTINREYNKRVLLQEDFLVMASQNLLFYLLFQFILLFLTLFFLMRSVLSHLKRMVAEITTLEKGSLSFRFSRPRGFEFRKLADQLNHLLEVIEEREAFIKEQSKFMGWQEVSSFLTHQLKNPLSSILVANQNILLRQTQGDPVVAESGEIIAEEAQRIENLINRLRGLTDFPDLRLTPVNFIQWLREMIHDYREIDLEIQGPDSLVWSIDQQLFKEALGNLIINSREAGGQRAIFKLSEEKGHVKLVYSDNITGLNPELLDKIFQPKFSTKKQGSGLGLAFVKRVVHLHKAGLLVELSKTGGLVFTITWKNGEKS